MSRVCFMVSSVTPKLFTFALPVYALFHSLFALSYLRTPNPALHCIFETQFADVCIISGIHMNADGALCAYALEYDAMCAWWRASNEPLAGRL